MAEYEPPTENLPIFDSSVFNDPASTAGLTPAQANLLYLKRTGVATSVATTTSFADVVQFDSALVIYNGKQNTSLGNGFLPLAVGQGDQNVVIGVGAGANGLIGQGNTVVGYFSASDTKTSGFSQNSLFGSRAGQHLTSGAGNTLIGQTTGNNITTGITNICLGNGAMANESSGSLSNNIVIGNNVQSGASNRIIIGDTTQTSMDLQVIPTPLGGGVIRMNNNLSMNNIQAIANRQISSSYYNFYATNNVSTLTYSGRLYGNLNSIVYDCPDINASGSSNHIFYCYNGATVLNSLQISNTGVTSGTPQPAPGNSSTIVPTTAWVQSAISAAVPGGGFTSGMMMPYAGVTAPSGFLMCDGSAVSTTTYAALFAIVGTKYDNFVTPPAGTFFLPDFRDRCPIGSNTVSPMSGNLQNGGLSNVVYNYNIYNGNKTITNNQMASHTHNLSWPTATYIDNVNTTNNTTTGGSSSRAVSGTSSTFPTTSGAPSNFFGFQSQGQYLPPVCSVNYIIKT